MVEQSPIPWGYLWVGLTIIVSGAVVAMSGWGQRETRRMDIFGKWVVGIGVGVMSLTLLVNGVHAGVTWVGGVIKTVIASTQPSPEMQAPTR